MASPPENPDQSVDEALIKEILQRFGITVPVGMQRSAAITLLKTLERPGTRPLGSIGVRH